MPKSIHLLILFTFSFFLASCNGNKKQEPTETNSNLKHAKGFIIDKSNSKFTKLIVLSPWDNYNTHSIYYLTSNDSIKVPEDGIKVITPVKTVVTDSATHLGFISILGELDKIVGVSDTKYIYNSYIHEKVKENKVKDLGDSFNLNTEELLLLNPQIIFTTAYHGDQQKADLLKRQNQCPVFNLEWKEPTLLGRAEWIKFIGAFFNKDAEADSIFNLIEHNYLEAKAVVKNKPIETSILTGTDYRGSWTFPAANSYAAQLFKDAKIKYFYENQEMSEGSLPLSIEEALVHFNSADLWINVNASSLSELSQKNKQYQSFKAFKNKNVYHNKKRAYPEGGNDYWESGVVRPDLILKDLIKIAHPTLLPDYELYYMQKLD